MRPLITIGVIGATGTAGSRVVARLRARDVAVVEISRAQGVDLISGRGLFQALTGVDVVIDVSNPMPPDGRSSITQALATATRNLVGTCAAHDIHRLVVSTIDGIEDPVFDGFAYYEGKRVAKEIVLDGPVPATIVRSTQWHEFATNPAAVSSRVPASWTGSSRRWRKRGIWANRNTWAGSWHSPQLPGLLSVRLAPPPLCLPNSNRYPTSGTHWTTCGASPTWCGLRSRRVSRNSRSGLPTASSPCISSISTRR